MDEDLKEINHSISMLQITRTLLLALVLVCSSAHAFEALPDMPPIPSDNPMTPAKIQLGHQLYFDKRLSRTNTVSCNSCHEVGGSGTDNQPFSTGVEGKKGGRNAPTVWNSAFLSVQFWDGRAATLEEQAKGPMINPVEMGMTSHDEVISRIAKVKGYQKEFKEVFGDNALTIDNVARAIASYERTLITPNSAFDRFIKGDKKAMSEQAQRGMGLVQTVGCTSCHMGPNFSGPPLPPGNGFFQKFPVYPGSQYEGQYKLVEDLGRFTVTHQETDKHLWRVPTWRNIALTAPYFHNGSVKTLDEAVRVMAKVQLDKTLKDAEVQDIVAFLQSLTGDRPHQTQPKLPQ